MLTTGNNEHANFLIAREWREGNQAREFACGRSSFLRLPVFFLSREPIFATSIRLLAFRLLHCLPIDAHTRKSWGLYSLESEKASPPLLCWLQATTATET